MTTSPFRALLGMLAYHKTPMIIAVVLSVVGAVLSLAQPMVVNRMVDSIGQGPIGAMVALLIGLLVVSSAVSAVQIYVMTRTAEAAVLSTRKQLIARMLRLPIRTYDAHRSGDLVTRLGADTTLVRSAFTGGLIDAVGGAVMIVGAIVAMGLIDLFMLLIVLGVCVATLLVVVFASSFIQRYTKKAQEEVGALGADTDRALGAIRAIRAAGAADRIESDLGDRATLAYRQGVKIAKIEGLLYPMSGLAMQGAFLAVLGIGGVRVAAGSISVADLVTFVLFLFMVAMPLGMVFGAITTIRSAMGALERIHQVLDEDEEPTGGITDVSAGGDLDFEDVTFAYDDDSTVLNNVSFTVPAGSTTALVGPSGSGKSTTLALIERFYEPQAGTIRIDGRDITDLDRATLRSQIGYVEQEAPILAGTVTDNLRLGAPDVTEQQCWEVLDKVGLSERFRAADGLDTVLGDRGVSLSGGQRQRLALARMLLMDTPILLLDEPTASVDSQNEQLIQEALREAGRQRTVIIVAHRLSTVTGADQLVVLNHGELEATGTHSELLESSDLYRDLASKQLLV